MITEDYVSFAVAKLLREKGFDEYPLFHYDDCGQFWTQGGYDKTIKWHFPAPTYQMVIKWLEEVHHILVVVDYVYECSDTSWVYKIYRLGENGKPERCAVKGVSYDDDNNPSEHIVGYMDYELSHKDFSTREEAEDEGIRYVLEKYV